MTSLNTFGIINNLRQERVMSRTLFKVLMGDIIQAVKRKTHKVYMEHNKLSTFRVRFCRRFDDMC